MILKHWNKFWFDSDSSQSLCLLRVFFVTIFLMKLLGISNMQYIEKLYLDFPLHYFKSIQHYYLDQDAFRMPIRGLEWLPAPSFETYNRIEDVLLITTIFFVIGLYTRINGTITATIYLYFFLLSQFTYRHHVMNLVIVLLILGFSRCYDHYSLDRFIKRKREKTNFVEPKERCVLPLRLVQVFLSIIYFFSFIQKLHPHWITGDITLLFYQQGSVSGYFSDFLDFIFHKYNLIEFSHSFWKFLGTFTVFAEGFLSFGLWILRFRRFAIFIGMILHLGIGFTVSIETFSLQMIVLYIAFINPKSHQNTVYYDSSNKRHRIFVGIGKMLDWLRRYNWVDNRPYKSPVINKKDISPSNIKSISLQTSDNEKRNGLSAVLYIFTLFPATFFFFYIPSALDNWRIKIKSI